MMLANELRYCMADIDVTPDNFEAGIGIAYDANNEPVLCDGWRDHSGMENHLLLRQGAVTYETLDDQVGAIFDGTALASMRQYLMMGAGTLIVDFAGGYATNTVRYPFTIEPNFALTVARTGNPAFALRRYVGGGTNRADWGVPGQVLSYNLAGAGTGDFTKQKLAVAVDNKPGREKLYAKLQGVAGADAAKNPNAHVLPRGADLIVGRLDSTKTDANRVPVTGNERLWLGRIAMYGNMQHGNLITDYPTELEALHAA